MRLRLLTGLVSPSGSWAEGDEYTTDEATARRMIESGAAVPWAVGGIELAVGEPGPEREMRPKGRGRRHV